VIRTDAEARNVRDSTIELAEAPGNTGTSRPLERRVCRSTKLVVPQVAPFHSVNEAAKPAERRVFDNNGACGPWHSLPRAGFWFRQISAGDVTSAGIVSIIRKITFFTTALVVRVRTIRVTDVSRIRGNRRTQEDTRGHDGLESEHRRTLEENAHVMTVRHPALKIAEHAKSLARRHPHPLTRIAADQSAIRLV